LEFCPVQSNQIQNIMRSVLQILLSSLLDTPFVESQTNQEKAISILKAYFTLTPSQMTIAYQDSYGYALIVISAGLVGMAPKKFADPIERHYLQPFAKEHGLSSKDLLTFQSNVAKSLKFFAKQKDQLFQIEEMTDEDLMALISYKNTTELSDLVLEQMRRIAPLDDTLAAFLRFDGQLGDSLLFFFCEIVRKKEQLEKTQAALQREGLCISVRQFQEKIEHFKGLQKNVPSLLNKITQQLTGLQQAYSAWQSHYEQLIRFSKHFENGLEELLKWAKELYSTLIYEDQSLLEKSLQKFTELMARQNLSSQIKVRDEFTHHKTANLKLIREAASQLKQLSPQNPEYNRFSLIVSSALSSTGQLEQAENFLLQLLENQTTNEEKALAYSNLFQVLLRRQAYTEAFKNLQSAIALDAQKYAWHDIYKYPPEKLLGAGGMGCVFLCRNNNKLIRKEWVMVKCFWENLKSFKEAIAMRDIAAYYILEPLDFGYLDIFKQERAFLVTEYIEGAIDGESWLEKNGPMDLKMGLTVGLQIAKALQLAHKVGIYHLYLKPANVLLKETETGIAVKITDFGLSQVASSLRSQAAASQGEFSKFGKAVFASLDYVLPESGKSNEANDIFAFGSTMYRFLTGLNPRPFSQDKLPEAPALRQLLFDCIKGDISAQQLFNDLKAIEDSYMDKKREAFRYTDNGNGTVTDNKTGLIWLKNANAFGRQNWKAAMRSVANIAHGQYDLTDGSMPGMWRLPTEKEWKAMVNNKYEKPALSNATGTEHWQDGDAFLNVQMSYYWSIADEELTNFAWYVYLYYGYVDITEKSNYNYVWPVRDGQSLKIITEKSNYNYVWPVGDGQSLKI